MAELAEITDRLLRVVEARYMPLWLVKPVEALDDRAPVELIAHGHARQVARLISALESPAPLKARSLGGFAASARWRYQSAQAHNALSPKYKA